MVFYGNNMVTLESADIHYLYYPILRANFGEEEKKCLVTI